jgi:hypothetical protein
MSTFLIGATSRCVEIRDAIAIADGLPRRVTVVGGPDMLPTKYTPGAAGWTEHLCAPAIEAGDGTAALELTVDAEKHLGKTVRVGEKDVVVPAARDKVDEAALEQKFRERLPIREAAARELVTRA